MRLEDGEIVLRRLVEADVPAIVAACQDPEIPRWTHVPSPYTEANARAFVAEVAEKNTFAITAAGDDRLLGVIGVRDLEEGRLNVGYWIAPWARGRRVATRALRLVSRFAVVELEAARVEVLTDRENLASQRVAERAGYVREGVLRSYILQKGARRDAVMFSLLPDDLS